MSNKPNSMQKILNKKINLFTPSVFDVGMFILGIFYTWAYLPIMQGYFGFFISEIYAVFFVAIYVLGVIILLASNKWKISLSVLFLIACCYVIFHLGFIVGGFVGTMAHFYRTIIFWSPLFVMAILHSNQKVSLSLFKFISFLLGITLLTTVIGIMSQSNIVRVLISTTSDTIDTNISIYRSNVAGLEFLQMLILFVPILMYMFLSVKKTYQKVIAIMLIIAIGYILLSASFTIAVLIYLLSIVLSLIFIANKRYAPIILLFGVVLLFVVPWKSVLFFFADNISNEYISRRIQQIAMFISEGAILGNLEDRMLLYKRSLNTFLNYPLGIGPIYKNIEIDKGIGIGYHSQLLDDLARYGVFAIPLHACGIVGMYSIIKKQWSKIGQKEVALVIVILYGLMLLFNLGLKSIYEGTMLFLIVPMIPEYILLKRNTEVKK